MEEEILNTIKKNQLQKINDAIYLTNKHIEILEKYHIPYKNCKDLSEILYYLEDYDEEEYDDLTIVATDIAELHYYKDMRK